MKRLIIALSVLALVGCHKEDVQYTSIEITATQAWDGMPFNDLEFTVSDYAGSSTKYASAVTRHGHCRMSFETSSRQSYSVYHDNEYVVVNRDWSTHVERGRRNVKEIVLSKNGKLQIDLNNVNYNMTNDPIQYRINPLNDEFYIAEKNAFWNSGYGIQTNGWLENYATYETAAVPYLVEWKLAGTNSGWSDTVKVYPDSTVHFLMEY